MEAPALTPAPHRPAGDAAAATCVISTFPMPAPKTSLSQLFEAEEAPLLYFALGLVGRKSVAEELVQEAFLRLHQVWADVENPRAWLYRSLRNLALNHLRDHRRETSLEGAPEPAHEGDMPPDAMGRNEAVGLVRMLLAELPDEDRQLIRLKYNENLKYQEIGQRTGLNAGNVGYRLHHLLKSLADSLRHAGVESSHG